MKRQPDLAMLKWVFRSNARRKQEYGVEPPAIKAFSPHGGESNRRLLSVHAAKAMARDNLECLRLMRSKKMRAHLAKLRIAAVEYYHQVKAA